MISAKDLYVVLSAVVPLYVAMILAYGSVRWWKILTPQQCGGINRFVAIFAVPLLSFHIIANNNPYTMNAKFVLADTIQKFAILIPLGIWARFSKRGSIEWMITLFMLATLPNTLVMGIPLLAAMYGTDSGSLVVQAVVLQCIIWYTMLLFFYEYRSARILISDQFPETAASIISFKVESDVMSLDGREPLQTEAEIGDDGKIHVTVRRSISSSSYAMLSPRRSTGLASMPSSKALTPRPSNMTGAEIYSIHSSRNMTPRESSFNHNDFYSMMGGKPMGSPRHSNFTHSDIYSLHSSRGPTPRTSNFAEEKDSSAYSRGPNVGNSPRFPPPIYFRRDGSGIDGNNVWAGNQGNNLSPKHSIKREADLRSSPKMSDDPKDLHMFVWSSNASPAPEGFGGPDFGANKQDSVVLTIDQTVPRSRQNYDDYDRDDFSFGNRASFRGDESLSTTDKDGPSLTKMGSSSTAELAPKLHDHKHEMPPASVMTRLIFNMVCRKLIRNPNTYSSLIGLTWALVSYRWHVNMPTIVEKSILILSSAGLGMAMFSLGLFMALQQRLLACGTSLAIFGMAVRFVTGPAVMAASSIAVGLRGVDLHVSIVQAALPQGIVPFVFAKEYNVHPDVLSTAVIFGMLVSFPITLLYYVLLGL